ncbi:DNA (cytosine-5-)-methyltransferase [Paenibacillus phytohabitans]|uniref:DNA (cytosine-5-)-methyltransferase n=1 Tax=Paenibacillus phytohabitans TaxID=2654978 RepID=UPI0030080403
MFNSTTLSRLSTNQNVGIEIIDRICQCLNCKMDDVIIHIQEEFQDTQISIKPKVKIKSSLNTISLFSGAGGLDLGLINSGFNIVFANDIYKPAIENYAHNIGHISEADIREIDASELPEADVVVGGFPCQPFSNAGNRLGTDDLRGNLYLDVIRVIKEKKPKVVIMENVRGLLSMKNKDGSKLIDSIIYLLENVDPGYSVVYRLLKASDYDIPQHRFRVVIVGVRKDLGFKYQFPAPIITDNTHLTVGHVLNIPEGTPNMDEVWTLSPQSQQLIEWIPEGGSWKDVPYEILPERLKKIRDNMAKYHSPNFYRRFGRNEINGTITAAATPENSGILHPIENRRYSVREIARIQSFPDDYIFVGSSVSSKYKVIGNAVPPKLAEIIGDSIVQQLAEAGY